MIWSSSVSRTPEKWGSHEVSKGGKKEEKKKKKKKKKEKKGKGKGKSRPSCSRKSTIFSESSGVSRSSHFLSRAKTSWGLSGPGSGVSSSSDESKKSLALKMLCLCKDTKMWALPSEKEGKGEEKRLRGYHTASYWAVFCVCKGKKGKKNWKKNWKRTEKNGLTGSGESEPVTPFMMYSKFQRIRFFERI